MRRLSGFSLMEMMVVLLIVSIVAAASAPMISKKVVGSAENDSPWVWTGLNNNIAYNLDNSDSSAIIGYKHTPKEAMQPKLYIQTESGKKYPQISLGEGKDSPSILKFLWSDNSVIMSSVSKDGDNGISKMGKNAVAIGVASIAKADNAIAIGPKASAQQKESISIGSNISSGVSAIALGAGTSSEMKAGKNSIAIGIDSNVDAADTVVIGKGIKTTYQDSVMIGSEAFVAGAGHGGSSIVAVGRKARACVGGVAIGKEAMTCNRGVAIGIEANNYNTHSVAIGDTAKNEASYGVAIGTKALTAYGGGEVAVGTAAKGRGEAAIAIGNSANAGGGASIAIGKNSLTPNTAASAIAIGFNSTAEGDRSMSIGHWAKSSANSTIAIGRGAKAYSDNAVALGYLAVASTSKDSVVIGANSNLTSSANSVAIGSGLTLTAANAVAIGSGVKVPANNGIGIGKGAISSQDAVAMGNTAQALSGNSVAIGSKANAGQNGTAIGYNAKATATNSVAIGHGPQATSSNAIAIGDSTTQATSTYTMAYGHNAKATSIGATALGVDTVASHSWSTALGYGARTTKHGQVVIGGASDEVYIPGNLVVGGSVTYDNLHIREDLVVDKNVVLGRTGGEVFIRTQVGPPEEGSKYNTPQLSRVFMGDDKGGDDNFRTLKKYGWTYTIMGFTISSDERLKNVGDKFKGGLEELKKLDLFHYTYKKDKEKTPHVGVMAQDLQKVFPNAVTKGEDGYLRIRWEDMFYALINAVKELDDKIIKLQKEEICTLKKDVATLKKQNADLEKRLAALEKKLK